MAENPFARFATPGVAVGGENPFSRFVMAEPDRPVLEGTVRPDPKSMAPAELAKYEYGIDVTGDKKEVRAAIGQLPAEQRKPAMDLWAKHFRSEEKKTQTPGQGMLSKVNDIAETIARGTPIGSWGDEIDAGLKQAAYTMTGGGMGAPYDEAVAYNRARQEEFDANNPLLSVGLKLGGAVASLPVTPSLAAGPSASMLSRIGKGALTGMGYGTLYGAGEGTDTGSRVVEGAKGLAIGGSVGAAAVPVAAGIGNATKFVADKYRGMPPEIANFGRPSVERVSRAMVDDNLYIPTPGQRGVVPPPPDPSATSYAQKAAQLGPEGMLADMGPNMLGQVKALTTIPGKGQQVLKSAMETRKATAADRIKADTDAVLGPAKNLVELEQQMVGAANARAKPLYDQFYESPVKISERLYGILDRAKAAGALDRAQKLMSVDGYDPTDIFYKGYANKGPDNAALNGRFLDYIKRALDDLAGAAAPGERETIRRYSSLAKALRDEVDNALSPGNPAGSVWAQARAASGDGMQFREGLEEGRAAFSKGTSPDQMRADLKSMPAMQRAAYREGARGQIRDIMGNAGTTFGPTGDNAARKALGSENAREKLRLIADAAVPAPGSPRATADNLVARLDAETQFERTRQQAYMGTETAARLAAQKEFPNKAARSEIANEVGKKSMFGAAAEAVYRGMNMLLAGHLDARMADTVTNTAKMLAAQGADRDRIAKALMRFTQSQAITQSGKEAITRVAQDVLNSPRFAFIDAAGEKTAK